MLVLEQSAHAKSSPFVPQCSLTQPPQQPFSCDYLDVETDLANLVSEEDLKINQTTLEFLANETALFEMFQVSNQNYILYVNTYSLLSYVYLAYMHIDEVVSISPYIYIYIL